jgi:hypothetical protein
MAVQLQESDSVIGVTNGIDVTLLRFCPQTVVASTMSTLIGGTSTSQDCSFVAVAPNLLPCGNYLVIVEINYVTASPSCLVVCVANDPSSNVIPRPTDLVYSGPVTAMQTVSGTINKNRSQYHSVGTNGWVVNSTLTTVIALTDISAGIKVNGWILVITGDRADLSMSARVVRL